MRHDSPDNESGDGDEEMRGLIIRGFSSSFGDGVGFGGVVVCDLDLDLGCDREEREGGRGEEGNGRAFGKSGVARSMDISPS